MYYDSDIITEDEISGILAEVPFDLIDESINDQISDPMNTSTDFLSTVTSKVDIYLERFEDTDPDMIAPIHEELKHFLMNILSRIDQAFDIGFDIDNIADSSDYRDIVESAYNYFILNYKRNIARYISNYIETYKETLYNLYFDPEKSDVSTSAIKKSVKDKQNAAIISNLPDVISYILSQEVGPQEFIVLSSEEDDYSAEVMTTVLNEGRMIGGFVYNYLGSCQNEYSYIYDEIQTEIRISLMRN